MKYTIHGSYGKRVYLPIFRLFFYGNFSRDLHSIHRVFLGKMGPYDRLKWSYNF